MFDNINDKMLYGAAAAHNAMVDASDKLRRRDGQASAEYLVLLLVVVLVGFVAWKLLGKQIVSLVSDIRSTIDGWND